VGNLPNAHLPNAHVTEGRTNMVAEKSTSRGDEQLEFILHETANWTVNGSQGVVLCEVASLQLALDKATQCSARGREVVALIRRCSPEIVVLSDQIRKIANRLIEPRGYTERCLKASVDKGGRFEGDLSVSTPYGAAASRDPTGLAVIYRK
jgi:hypothetical protein